MQHRICCFLCFVAAKFNTNRLVKPVGHRPYKSSTGHRCHCRPRTGNPCSACRSNGCTPGMIFHNVLKLFLVDTVIGCRQFVKTLLQIFGITFGIFRCTLHIIGNSTASAFGVRERDGRLIFYLFPIGIDLIFGVQFCNGFCGILNARAYLCKS